jgi:hypothetical protein
MPQQKITTSFGQYIDTLIRLYAIAEKKGLTDYIKQDLSNDSNENPARVSSRQISRMRQIGATEFPEGKGLLKLLGTLPGELQNLNPIDICNRLLAGTEPYLSYQRELLDKYSDMVPLSITIASGRQAPLALESDEIVGAMTKAIEKGVKYTFVYPHESTYEKSDSKMDEVNRMTNSWKLAIKRRVIRHWENIQETEAIREAIESKTVLVDKAAIIQQNLGIFKNKVETSIDVVHSKLETDFWFLLPSNYSVFYNIESKYEKMRIPRYGAFKVSGSPIIRASQSELEKEGLTPVNTSGWLRIDENEFQELAQSYVFAFPEKNS